MGSRLNIRPIAIDDLPAVYVLGCGIFTVNGIAREWQAETIAEILAADIGFSFVAVQGKKILAFIIAGHNVSEQLVKIYWLGLSPKIAITGIKEQLVFALRRELQTKNIPCLGVEIDAVNETELQFFQKIGFTVGKHCMTMTSNV